MQANFTTSANALNLIRPRPPRPRRRLPPSSPTSCTRSGPIRSFFAPQINETPDGTLISVAEAREGEGDSQVAGFGETYSTDGGQTWSPINIIYSVPNFPYSVGAIGSLVVDQHTGAVFFFFSVNDDDPMVMSSTDDGRTWSAPVDLTSRIMNPSWQWLDFGPGNGIQLTVGPDAGRLMVAFDYRDSNTNGVPSYNAVAYSDDDGATWQLGGGPDPDQSGQRRRERSRHRAALRRFDLHEQPHQLGDEHRACAGPTRSAPTAASPGATCNTSIRSPCRASRVR